MNLKVCDKEYRDFLDSESLNPPEILSQNILNAVRGELNPSKGKVLFKMLLGQTVGAVMTLFICPQFHMGFLSDEYVFHFFHRTFGDFGCMMACGMLFMGTGALVASVILKKNEFRALGSYRNLYYPAVSLVGLSVFFFLGAKIYLTFASGWLLGGMLGSFLAFQFIAFVKRKLLHS